MVRKTFKRVLSLVSRSLSSSSVPSPSALSPVEIVAAVVLPLRVGAVGAARKTLGAADAEAFAALLGDTNVIHRAGAGAAAAAAGSSAAADSAAIAAAPFGGRAVAHGMLSAGLIGTVFGRQVPGAVYVSQTLRFRKPVFLGDTVEARVTVTAARSHGAARNLLTCDTRVVRVACAAGGPEGGEGGAGAAAVGDVVVEGEATFLAPAT